MKKFLTLIAMLSFTCIFRFSIGAYEESVEILHEPRYLSATKPGEAISDSVDVDALTEYLREEFKNCVNEIDISGFCVPKTEEAGIALRDIIYDSIPEAFHLEGNFSLGYYGSIYSTIYMDYIYSPDVYNQMLEQFEKGAESLVSDLKGNNAISDVEKALLLHDRLAIACEYDEKSRITGNIPDISYTSYGALVEGVAVCQGYAEAYMYLLEAVGIDSYVCSSIALNHAWNIVEIDGELYHVDVTWDDPVWDVSGRVYHKYFLCSTDNFIQSHTAYDYDSSPDDTTYDNYFWTNSKTSFVLLDNGIYYIDNVSQSLKTYGGSVLVDISDSWRSGLTSAWVGNFSRLCSDGESLYYTKSDSVYIYDIENAESTKIYEMDHSFGDYFFIYGISYDGAGLYIEFNNRPGFDSTTKSNYTLYHELPKKESSPIVYGDVNGDEVVDGKDLVRLKKYLASYDFDTCTSPIEISNFADANGDGFVDGKDLVRLKKYMAAYDFDTGKSDVSLGP